eukprot:COSAG01_NODE_50470_length_363_cov_0.753788_1_plen_32_part_01
MKLTDADSSLVAPVWRRRYKSAAERAAAAAMD